ncbi:MAG: class I SAM-dependent methyltransferase [Acidobacteriota bacterium]
MNDRIRNEFIEVPMRPGTMFYYVPRTGILRAVSESADVFHGVVLDVGCGFMPYREIVESNPKVTKYVGMDLEGSELYGRVEPDLIWNGTTIPMPDGSVDCIMATEFLEHHSDPAQVLAEFYRVLAPGGSLFATVPFIWNLHEIPHDEYRYTPFSLSRIIGDAGFSAVTVRGLGGWNASMAQMIGLWITFAGMPPLVRTILRITLFPVFAALVRTDRRPESFDDKQNSMFTGLSVTAEKQPVI